MDTVINNIAVRGSVEGTVLLRHSKMQLKLNGLMLTFSLSIGEVHNEN